MSAVASAIAQSDVLKSPLLDEKLGILPRDLRAAFANEWQRIATYTDAAGVTRCRFNGQVYLAGDKLAADCWLDEMIQPFEQWSDAVKTVHSEHQVRDSAAQLAGFFREFVKNAKSLKEIISKAIEKGAHENSFDGAVAQGVILRVQDERFWRRQLRKTVARTKEAGYRNHMGWVHRRRQLYCSDTNLNFYLDRKQRQKHMMSLVEFVNELGESFSGEELVEKSMANPKLRKGELMVRMKGFEEFADACGHIGEFFTITCPSAYHARHYAGCVANLKFNGTTPRQAQNYLQGVWCSIRAALERAGIQIYGFRVAEPHHDGTPHWHGLVFMEPQQRSAFRRIVARYACREDKQELKLRYHQTQTQAKKAARAKQEKYRLWAETMGRSTPSLAHFLEKEPTEAAFWDNPPAHVWKDIKARVDFAAIDKRKGTAAGYIAKYIAKNVDGYASLESCVGIDDESDGQSTAQTALRVNAWASLWGIRQFQQLGGPQVTIWREMRRLEPLEAEYEETMMQAVYMADQGNWKRFIEIMGGIKIKRKHRPVQLYKEETGETNAYGEPRPPLIRGVIDMTTGVFKISHVHEWKMQMKGGAAAPWTWTCVNNCTDFQNPPKKAATGAAPGKDWLEAQKTQLEGAQLPKWLKAEEREYLDEVERYGYPQYPLPVEEPLALSNDDLALLFGKTPPEKLRKMRIFGEKEQQELIDTSRLHADAAKHSGSLKHLRAKIGRLLGKNTDNGGITCLPSRKIAWERLVSPRRLRLLDKPLTMLQQLQKAKELMQQMDEQWGK